MWATAWAGSSAHPSSGSGSGSGSAAAAAAADSPRPARGGAGGHVNDGPHNARSGVPRFTPPLSGAPQFGAGGMRYGVLPARDVHAAIAQ